MKQCRLPVSLQVDNVPYYSITHVDRCQQILTRGGIFRYLFRKFFLKSPILPLKRGV